MFSKLIGSNCFFYSRFFQVIDPSNLVDFDSLTDVLNQLPPVIPVRSIYLHVLRTNYEARHFYEKRGFVYLRVRPSCYTIDGKFADGCTYVLPVNGGFICNSYLYPCHMFSPVQLPNQLDKNKMTVSWTKYNFGCCVSTWLIWLWAHSNHSM